MAYRGGNIDLVIKGDIDYNLDTMDFKVLVYPDRHPDKATTILKSQMIKVSANRYSGTIGYEITKKMSLGLYTIEVLIIESSTSRSVFLKPGVFPLYESASEDIA